MSPQKIKYSPLLSTATATAHYAELNCSCAQPASSQWLYAVCLQIAHFSTSKVNYQKTVMDQNWPLC